MQKKRVTICSCVSRSFINKDKVAEIAAILRNEGYDVTVEPDLCKKLMQQAPEIFEIASSTILACYPRAVRSLFHSHNIVPQQVLDIRNGEIPGIIEQLHLTTNDISGKEAFQNEIESFASETGTDAWYPVIDKDRCSECGRCHDFCLFGVYSVENKQVKVVQPQNCKNNCPACARICPEKAIIFPKYEKSPINGGLEDEEQAVGLDTDAIYAEALRMRLKQRRASVSLLKQDGK